MNSQHLLLRARPDLRLDFDSDAIQIGRAAANPQRFPLYRLGMVTIVGDIAIPSGLITELANRGIALRFMRTGQPEIAMVLSNTHSHGAIDAELDALQFIPDWRSAYIRWRARQDFWGALRALRGKHTLRLGIQHIRPTTVSRLLFRHRPNYTRLLGVLVPLLRADVVQTLHMNGWPLHRLRLPYPGIHASRDLLRATLWEAIAALAETREEIELPPDAWYTRHRPLLLRRAELALDALRRFIVQTTTSTLA